MEAIQYCGGIASVHLGILWGDSISTAEAIQYCGVKFLIFLYSDIVTTSK